MIMRWCEYSVLLLVAATVLMQCVSVEGGADCNQGDTNCEQCDDGQIWYNDNCEDPVNVPCSENGTRCPEHSVCDTEHKKCKCETGYTYDGFDCVMHFDPIEYCKKCINIRNGPNHYPDPLDCSSYYLCTGKTGDVKAYHKSCAPCTYWNQDMLTCVHLEHANCPEAAPPKKKFPVSYSCCCYRVCEGYTSEDKCCPARDGYGFSYAAQKCVKNNCNDSCIPQTTLRPTYTPPNTLPTQNPSCLVLHMPMKEDFKDLKHNYVDSGEVVLLDGAAYFRGFSHIEVPLFNNYYWGNQVTLSFWYKTDMEPKEYVTRLLSNGNCDGFGTIGVKMEAEFISGTITTNVEEVNVITQPINHKQWHHVAMTYDGEKLSLYIDGNLVDSEEANGNINSYHAPLQISTGYCEDKDESDFQWYMNEVKVFRCSLSSDEVMELFNKGH